MQGIEKENCSIFKGIPYAKAPVGKLRFCAPERPDSWEDIRKADAFTAKCMQISSGGGFYDKEFYDDPAFKYETSEDSLYLNIWTPAKTAEDKLPVLFWIHGGAYNHGSGMEKEFDGEAIAAKGVILVTINYRVNIYGFLAHPWLTAENPRHISGNYGILDQIAALDYVVENIAAFGGDPANITVFGQSAGAMSVQTLISSPLTGDKIAHAIMQSGGGYGNGLNRDITLAEQEKIGQQFVEMTGAKNLEELRAIPAQKLSQIYEAFTVEMMKQGKFMVMVPNIDGYLLTEGYSEVIEKGHIKNIPYILGSTKNDIFTNPEDVAAGRLSALYTGCEAFADQVNRNGHAPAYLYYFTRQLPGDDAGAFHSSELWYVFGTLGRAWRPFTEADYQLSEEMIEAWTNFAKSGNPGNWQAYDEQTKFVKVFDI